MEITKTEPKIELRLPWHKPEVRRLAVSLDTRQIKAGSDSDGTSPTPLD